MVRKCSPITVGEGLAPPARGKAFTGSLSEGAVSAARGDD